MDAAGGLVEIYLRVNGYLTLSEWSIQVVNDFGQWDTVTDVDIVGLRFPGQVFLADSHDLELADSLMVHGELLKLEPDTIDVIVGEVKEGEAVFNPALSRHETLHTVLHRLAWLYANHGLDRVVADLATAGTCYSEAPGGGRVRTRLVAFGQAPHLTTNTIPMALILEAAAIFLNEHDALLRSVRFSNPVAAALKLLHKSGFEVTRRE